jgi:hypothetical protein
MRRSSPVFALLTFPGRAARWTALNPIRTSLIFIAIGMALLLGAPLWNVGLAGIHLYQAQRLARTAGSGGNSLAQIPPIHQELSSAASNLERAHGELAGLSPGFRLVGRLPGLGWVGATPELAGLGAAGLAAGSDLVGSLEPVNPPTTSRWRDIVDALDHHPDRISLAGADLDRAAAFRQRIDRRAFAGAVGVIGTGLDDFDRYFPLARGGIDALSAAPALLGAGHPVSYILAGQNEEERRANGGFMGSLGIARIDRGNVTQLEIRNSYDFGSPDQAPLPPPSAMAEWMGFGGWYIRDANWFPNFPTSAAWIEWFWNYYYGEQTDGVIAFDEEVIRQLLVETGPIDIPDLKEHITADNYRERTLYWLYEAGSPNGDRQFVQSAKTPFVKELGTELFKRLLSLSLVDFARFTPSLFKLLDEKHLQLSVKNEKVAALLAQRGWDGHLNRDSPDYLLASDTTVAYSKVAPFVKETIDDRVQLSSDGSAQADVTVSYANNYDAALVQNTYPKGYLGEFWNRATAKRDYIEGYYATYLRLYVPATARSIELKGGDEQPTIDAESGRQVVATFVTLLKGSQRAIHLRYVLPPGTWSVSHPYQLLVQKQPGTLDLPLTVTVSAPAGSTLAQSGTGTAAWHSELLVDRPFVVAVNQASARAP